MVKQPRCMTLQMIYIGRVRKNYTLQHAAERVKIYAKEKFTYKIYDVKI